MAVLCGCFSCVFENGNKYMSQHTRKFMWKIVEKTTDVDEEINANNVAECFL